jgi:AraC family transcriptional regulator
VKAGETLSARVSRHSAPVPTPPTRNERRTDPAGYPHSGPRLAPWQVKQATKIMEERLGDAVLISELAGACRLSISHFVRAFTNTVGVAPYSWFLDQRILRAMDLLVQTHASLAEIALDCGFSDQSHFTNTFVRRAGTTPLQWRREAEKSRSLSMAESGK